MNVNYPTSIQTSSGMLNKICCLADVRSGKDSLAIFKLDSMEQIIEITN